MKQIVMRTDNNVAPIRERCGRCHKRERVPGKTKCQKCLDYCKENWRKKHPNKRWDGYTEIEDRQEFADWLYELRVAEGLTQKAFCDKHKLGNLFCDRVENGRYGRIKTTVFKKLKRLEGKLDGK